MHISIKVEIKYKLFQQIEIDDLNLFSDSAQFLYVNCFLIKL